MIARSYYEAFGRDPIGPEAPDWFTRMQSTPMSYTEVLRHHVDWLTTLKHRSEREALIRLAFQATFRPVPDASTVSYWSERVLMERLTYSALVLLLR